MFINAKFKSMLLVLIVTLSVTILVVLLVLFVKAEKAKNVRYGANLAPYVESALQNSLGADFENRVQFRIDTPTGLLDQNHRLELAPNSQQTIVLYSDNLSQTEVAAIVKDISQQLQKERVTDMVPVWLQVYPLVWQETVDGAEVSVEPLFTSQVN